jgi:hypothetical protein
MSMKELQALFTPGLCVGRMVRRPNRLKRGFLKKSIFTFNVKGYSEQRQGLRECARRLRQLKGKGSE